MNKFSLLLKYGPLMLKIASIGAELAKQYQIIQEADIKKLEAMKKGQQTSIQDKALILANSSVATLKHNLIQLFHDNFLTTDIKTVASVQEIDELSDECVNLVVAVSNIIKGVKALQQ